MRILFVSQASLKKELGGPKVLIELAETLNELGHTTAIVGPEEVTAYLLSHSLSISKMYADNVAVYLNRESMQYDVIDVDANYLYQFVQTSASHLLVVARSVLFAPHFLYIKYPYKNKIFVDIKDLIRKYLFGTLSKKERIKKFYKSMDLADVINVSNERDVRQLLADGYSKSKILNLPYGLSEKKRQQLKEIASIDRSENSIVFLGTFDYRKGCLDTPKLYKRIKAVLPDATLTLLGAKGHFTKASEMYKFFPRDLRSSIAIIPMFNEAQLPDLLKKFKIAVFPSYIEGFGFSVIENMAAGIPVIAYNSPGPSSILRHEYLVLPGDWKCMADKIVYYLKNDLEWRRAKFELLQDSQKFDWKIIASDTVTVYKNFIQEKDSRN